MILALNGDYPLEKFVQSDIGIDNSVPKTAILPLGGPVLFSDSQFGLGTAALLDRLRRIEASEVTRLIIPIRSPGGLIFGVPEISDQLDSMETETIAVAWPYALSAAYWIGASADKFFALGSGVVGSVGVYSAREDVTEFLKKIGFDIRFSSFGPFKLDGHPDTPVTDDEMSRLQTEVDDAGKLFVDQVARGRRVSVGDVLQNFGQGAVVTAQDAADRGMIDGVISSMSDVLPETRRRIKKRVALNNFF